MIFKKNLIRSELENDLAQYLMDKGFSPKDSFEMARDFWKRNYKKIKEVIS